MTAQPRHLTFFCELDTPELEALFADGTLIAQLAALRARVSLGLRDLSAARAAVVHRLGAAGIPTIAWQLLPDEQGYLLARALHRAEGAFAARLEQARESTAANTVAAAPRRDLLHPGALRYFREAGLAP